MRRLLQDVSPLMLFLALVLAGYWLTNTNRTDERADAAQPPLLVLHEGTSYRYNGEGKRELTLTSVQTTYYNDARGTLFNQPSLTRESNGATATLQAPYAEENHAQTGLSLTGGVIGTYQNPARPRENTEIRTETLRYNIPNGQADTTTPIELRTADSITHATGTIWHLNQNLFILQKNVRSQYAPHP